MCDRRKLPVISLGKFPANYLLGATAKKTMNTQRILSVLTVLLGLYAAWDASHFFSALDLPGVRLHVVPSLVITLCGILGGVLLWKGVWLGYLGSTVAWATTLVTGVSFTAVEFASGMFVPLAAIISIPVLVLFYLAIRAKKRSERT